MKGACTFLFRKGGACQHFGMRICWKTKFKLTLGSHTTCFVCTRPSRAASRAKPSWRPSRAATRSAKFLVYPKPNRFEPNSALASYAKNSDDKIPGWAPQWPVFLIARPICPPGFFTAKERCQPTGYASRHFPAPGAILIRLNIGTNSRLLPIPPSLLVLHSWTDLTRLSPSQLTSSLPPSSPSTVGLEACQKAIAREPAQELPSKPSVYSHQSLRLPASDKQSQQTWPPSNGKSVSLSGAIL